MKRRYDLKQENVVLGRKIASLRQTLDIPSAQFAKKINITHQQLEKYEAGKDMVPLSILERIEEKYDIYLPKKTLRAISSLRSSGDDHVEVTENLIKIYEDIWD
ncbi:MAG: helix-turn-helix transcriptional regulator [Pseudomonadota bacterium]